MGKQVRMRTRSTQMCAACYECETVMIFRYMVDMNAELMSHYESDYPAPSLTHDISVRCNQCGNLMYLYRDGFSRLSSAIQNKLGLDKMLINKHSMPKYETVEFIFNNSINKEFTYPIAIFIADNNDELWNKIRDMIIKSANNFSEEDKYDFILVEIDNDTAGSISITFDPDKFISYYRRVGSNVEILEYMRYIFMDLLDYIAYNLE